MSTPGYHPRDVDATLAELLATHPAVWITGPRACGKSTTARRFARTVVSLDQPAAAAAFEADPDAALRGLRPPVLLDEWQVVPGVLGAIKRAVDADTSPGRFIVTGSARAALDTPTWPGTGRLIHLPMWGMTQGEIDGTSASVPFIDRLAAGHEFVSPVSPPDLRGYLERAVRGGFPEPALRLSGRARERFHDSYIEQMVQRDAAFVDRARDPERLRRYFEVTALHTAEVVEDQTLFGAAGISRTTAVAYDSLLRGLSIMDDLPAWHSNRLKRLVKTAKRQVVDPALTASILRVDADAVLRDGSLMGRLLDCFVVAQLRPQMPLSRLRPRLHHLRVEQGRHEVDLLIELAGGRVLGLEVKASAAPTVEDARHLAWLRDALGDAFVAGAVLHTGPRAFSLGDRLHALPIACVWT